MLEIRDIKFFPDGRSVVDTIGGRRFRVLSRGTKDGYCTARVEFLQDTQLENRELAGVQQRYTKQSFQYPIFHRTRAELTVFPLQR